MRTWEVIKALTENPKLKFVDGIGRDISIRNGVTTVRYGDENSIFDIDEDWDLVQEPVDFVTALTCGKLIRPAGTNLKFLDTRSALYMLTGENNEWGANRDKCIKGLWEIEN